MFLAISYIHGDTAMIDINIQIYITKYTVIFITNVILFASSDSFSPSYVHVYQVPIMINTSITYVGIISVSLSRSTYIVSLYLKKQT